MCCICVHMCEHIRVYVEPRVDITYVLQSTLYFLRQSLTEQVFTTVPELFVCLSVYVSAWVLRV